MNDVAGGYRVPAAGALRAGRVAPHRLPAGRRVPQHEPGGRRLPAARVRHLRRRRRPLHPAADRRAAHAGRDHAAHGAEGSHAWAAGHPAEAGRALRPSGGLEPQGRRVPAGHLQVPEEKIAFIHHGIPDVPFVDPNYYKDQFGVEGRRVILTFGLLSPNKGIEHMVRALPAIVERYPDTVYIVLGVTHPHVLRHDGESYRLSLQQLAKTLGVAGNILFQNRFVDDQELSEFLGATDIYVTPYGNEAQISSGTLAYAVGSGKAIVSTPYWYATEMLAEERGRLVPFNDPEATRRAGDRSLRQCRSRPTPCASGPICSPVTRCGPRWPSSICVSSPRPGRSAPGSRARSSARGPSRPTSPTCPRSTSTTCAA